MTTEEFVEFWKWMEARWSSMTSRTRAEKRAYWDELGKYEIADVKAAVDLCVRADPTFAPGCMTLGRAAQEVALQSSQRRALPEPHVDAKEALQVFREQHGGRLPSEVHRELDVKGMA